MSAKNKEQTFTGKLLPSISTANLGITMDDIRECVKKAPAKIFEVFGSITALRYGKTKHGEFIDFKGQFEVINNLTGEVVRSGSVFLPSIVANMVEAQFLKAKNVEGFSGYLVDFMVGAKKSDKPIGYEYTVQSNIEPDEEDDFLTQMRNSRKEQKTLAGPK